MSPMNIRQNGYTARQVHASAAKVQCLSTAVPYHSVRVHYCVTGLWAHGSGTSVSQYSHASLGISGSPYTLRPGLQCYQAMTPAGQSSPSPSTAPAPAAFSPQPSGRSPSASAVLEGSLCSTRVMWPIATVAASQCRTGRGQTVPWRLPDARPGG